MLPWPSASVAILGSGAAFPTCIAPWGERLEGIETGRLLEFLTPDLTEERRAPIAAHLHDMIGVRSRSWARFPGTRGEDGEEDSVSLAVGAAKAALAAAGISPSDVGAIVLGTSTPPKWTSAASAAVAGALEIRCPFFDVRSGCAGGLYSIALASILAASGKRPVLAIGTDTFSKILPPEERFAALSVGDGAGALLLSPAEGGCGLIAAGFDGDGAFHHLATVNGEMPPITLERSAWTISGDPAAFSAVTERALVDAMKHADVASPLDGHAVHLVHAGRREACQRVSESAAKRASLWSQTLEQHGSLGAASVAIAIHELLEAKALPSGETLAIVSAGGGPSWGYALWRQP